MNEGGTIMDKFLLKLYVTGQTPRSERAIANLHRICEKDLGGRYQMVVIDVLERPQLAEDEKILATPTLIKSLPPPLRRVIGDLSNTEKVLLGLDMQPVPISDFGLQIAENNPKPVVSIAEPSEIRIPESRREGKNERQG
jgi:circadian clock protein KaiB